jgi:predicted ATPase
MSSDVAFEFRTDGLSPDQLARPFEILTNWHVIVGAPSCGKTTLIEQLAGRGFRTVPEPARAYLEAEVARGRTIDDLHRDGATLQRRIMDLQSLVETSRRPGELLFLDGAVPSSMAWYRAFGLDPNEILPKCFRHRYAAVFLLDPLPLDVDDVRFGDPELVSFLDRWIADDFRALGYDLVRVPVLPPEARLAFVLERFALERSA